MKQPDPRPLLAVAVPLLLALTLPAQKTTTSPSGWDNTEAPGICSLLGSLPEGRFQFLDGEVQSLSAKITQVDFRLDQTFAFDDPARSWGTVILLMAPCDVRRHSTILDSNSTATPQLMFVSNLSWPAVKNSTVGKPAPFGGGNGEYRFPLRAPYAKAANQDLLLDFAFSKGTLANSAPWTSLATYPLDGFSESEYEVDPARILGSPNCVETGQSRAAMCEAGLYTYRKQAATTQRADKVVAWLSTFFAAPSTPVVQALGTIQNTPTPIGSCQSLWLQPLVLVHAQSDVNGTASVYLGAIPYQPVLAGVRIGAQSAYSSPKTSRLELTLATERSIAVQPGPYSVNAVSYWAAQANAIQGSFADHTSNPLFRYTYQ